jgi:hypothetical protein
VVLVARTHASGLRAAQAAARQWASGALPTVRLLGLIAVADAPGKRPRALRELLELISGGVPQTWELPWVEALRLGDLLTTTAGDFGHHMAAVLFAAPPDPGTGEAPPGAEKLLTLLKWVAWVVFGLCVAGILIVAGRMAVMHQRGSGGEHASGLAWVAAACILAGSASSIVALLI